MLVSVIIPFYKWFDGIPAILSLKVDIEDKLEFIIVINGKKHLSDQIRKACFCHNSGEKIFHFVELGENKGAAVARNAGLAVASGSVIVFLDSDIIPEESLLVKHVQHYKANRHTTGVLGDVRFFDIKNLLQKAVHSSGFDGGFVYPSEMLLDWGPTANISFSREAIGLLRFDTSFPKQGGGEDVDFGIQVTEKTKTPIITDNEAICHHKMWNGSMNNCKRFFRWGSAEYLLMQKHPDRVYLAYPNYFELPVILFLLYLFFGAVMGVYWLPLLSIGNWSLITFIESKLKLLNSDSHKSNPINIEKTNPTSFTISIISDFFLFVYEAGSFYGRLRNFSINNLIFHRFDYEPLERRDASKVNREVKKRVFFQAFIYSIIILIEFLIIIIMKKTF